MRSTFPKIIEKIINKDKNTVVLLGDIGVYSFKNIFEKYPNQILNLSTLEQTMIGFAAGLVKNNHNVFIHSISPFLILRALEQLKIDFCYNKLPINLISVGGSFEYSKLGSTHHCSEDVMILDKYGFKVFIPKNEIDLKKLIINNYNKNQFNYFRVTSLEQFNTLDQIITRKYNKKKNNLIIVGPIRKFISDNKENLINFNIINISSPCLSELKGVYFENNHTYIYEDYIGSVLEFKIRKKYTFAKVKTLPFNTVFYRDYGTPDEAYNNIGFSKKKFMNYLND